MDGWGCEGKHAGGSHELQTKLAQHGNSSKYGGPSLVRCLTKLLPPGAQFSRMSAQSVALVGCLTKLVPGGNQFSRMSD